MQSRPISFVFVALIVCRVQALWGVVAVGASPDISQPSQSTSYGITSGSFVVTENVALDDTAGPWNKNLTNNTGSPILSGNQVPIVETLTNVGIPKWTDWHESIVPTNPGPSVGFLFRENTLSLQADYGSGFVALAQGTDYTLSTTPGPPGAGVGPNDWKSIDIFFAPTRAIGQGDVLRIQKNIFEIFGDANVWEPGESAIVAEFPTPEPGSCAILLCSGLTLLMRRRNNA